MTWQGPEEDGPPGGATGDGDAAPIRVGARTPAPPPSRRRAGAADRPVVAAGRRPPPGTRSPRCPRSRGRRPPVPARRPACEYAGALPRFVAYADRRP